MTNGSVQWFLDKLIENGIIIVNRTTYQVKYKHEILLEQAKEMEVMGKEMSYSDGYKEGYQRALEVMEWYIKNHISGMAQEHIGEANKMINDESNP
jgi:flagellar biosynthesis/type III secretory pathway protein FliH